MGRSIQEMYNNFKHILKDDTFFYATLLVLISIVSFGLGRWSVAANVEKQAVSLSSAVIQSKNQPATIPAQETSTSTAQSVTMKAPAEKTTATASQGQYVGSKNGTKYHLLSCPGAKQIKDENKVFFSSKEDAQKLGYSPASNCKGI